VAKNSDRERATMEELLRLRQATFPSIQLRMPGDVLACIPPRQYFFESSEGVYCVGIMRGTSDVVGANLLQGFHVTFDESRGRIGWARAQCDSAGGSTNTTTAPVTNGSAPSLPFSSASAASSGPAVCEDLKSNIVSLKHSLHVLNLTDILGRGGQGRSRLTFEIIARPGWLVAAASTSFLCVGALVMAAVFSWLRRLRKTILGGSSGVHADRSHACSDPIRSSAPARKSYVV